MKLKNPFRFLSPAYRRERKQLKTLKAVSESVAHIKDLVQRNLIYWQPRQRHYIIEQSIAEAYLTKPNWWFAFMKMLSFYVIDEQGKEARKKAEIDVRAKAVREAKKQYAMLTKADIDRIGRHAVDTMEYEAPVMIEEFDIAVVRATAPSSAEATESNGQLVMVAHYHIDGKFEMALWDDIKHNLQNNE